MTEKPIIAIAMGDPAGIGPEIIAKVARQTASLYRSLPALHHRRLRGSCGILPPRFGLSLPFHAFRRSFRRSDSSPSAIEVLNPPGFHLGRSYHRPPYTPNWAKRPAATSNKLINSACGGVVGGVVMAPMNKESFRAAGYDYYRRIAIPRRAYRLPRTIHPRRRRLRLGGSR